MRGVFTILSIAMAVIFCFSMSLYFGMIAWALISQAFLASKRTSTRPYGVDWLRNKRSVPGVSIIMPAYNEEVVIVECVASALDLDYPELEIVVVSDGSKDRTVEVLVDAFGLVEAVIPVAGPLHCGLVRRMFRSPTVNLTVVDKTSAGAKADALNCGLNLVRHDWVVCMDADTLINPDTILRCMTEVMHTPGKVAGVGVTLLPTNACVVEDGKMTEARVSMNYWVGCQTAEYLSGFLLARPGMSAVGALPIISGAFGIFQRADLLRVGGYRHPHLGEDLEMVMNIHRYYRENGIPYRMLQVPEAIVWTEFPQTRQVLERQRTRWHRGLRQVINSHKDLILNRRYGRFGMLGVSTMYFSEWLAALAEASGYVIFAALGLLGWLSLWGFLALFFATQMVGVLLTTMSVMSATKFIGCYKRRSDVWKLLLWAVVSQIGYRQFTLVWRIKSLKKSTGAWGEMPRLGHAKPAASKV